MPSETELANDALLRLGEKPITDIDNDGTKNSNLAKQFLPRVRRSTFREHAWNSLTKRIQLAALAETPPFGFDNQFQVPGDNIRIMRLGDIDETWKLENGKILTDASGPLDVIYIADITDPTQWGDDLFDTISTRLSAEMAPAITGIKTSIIDRMWELYSRKLREAKMSDGQIGTVDPIVSTDLLDARFGFNARLNDIDESTINN